MTPNQRYDRFREKIAGRAGSYSEYLLLTPDLILLVVRLLADPRVPRRQKLYLVAAMAYVMSPIDLLPRRLFGPIGYLDDVIVLVVALNILLNETHPDVVLENWSGDTDLLASVQGLLRQVDQAIGKERLERILEYLGLRQASPSAAPEA